LKSITGTSDSVLWGRTSCQRRYIHIIRAAVDLIIMWSQADLIPSPPQIREKPVKVFAPDTIILQSAMFTVQRPMSRLSQQSRPLIPAHMAWALENWHLLGQMGSGQP